MANLIGLNVIEVDGVGAPAIVGAAVSVGAFNLLARAGLANKATKGTSLQQFQDRFGSYFANGLGPYLIKGFFDNGGQTAYVNRVVASNAAAATLTLNDGASKGALELDAGFRGDKDKGSWGNELGVSLAANTSVSGMLRETAKATVAGADIAEPVDMTPLPTLSVKLNAAAAATHTTFQESHFRAQPRPTPTPTTVALHRPRP